MRMQHDQQLAALRDELESTKNKLAATQWELAKTRDELSFVYASRSWRITEPLRRTSGKLRVAMHAARSWPAAKHLRRAINKLEEYGVANVIKKYLKPEASRKSIPLLTVPFIPYEEERDFAPEAPDVRLIAYYLPQFHAFPENDAWWGKGFTEWTNVRRALPFFPGHVQPPVPHASLGYYDLGEGSGPDILRKQAAMAQKHGIYGFCFHHYWFSGKRLMEKPVDSLLENTDIDLPFCLNWANENWTRRWDGLEQNILIAQDHTPDDDSAFMRDVLRYFRDPRYIRINGRPVFLVYHADLLPDAKQTLERWRVVCAENNESEPFFVMVQSFTNVDPRVRGFDAVAQFPPHAAQRPVRLESVAENFQGRLLNYMQVVDSIMGRWTREYTLFPGVMPGWDNTPRRMEHSSIYIGATPQLYEEWLRHARAFARDSLPPESRFVFINSWNEWAEGAQLEPSQAHGFAYLNATSRALKS